MKKQTKHNKAKLYFQADTNFGKLSYLLKGSLLAKLKQVFLSCYLHEIYRVETVGLMNYNYI